MKHLIINPHNCSREELEDLKTYLDENCWDNQELSSNDVNELKGSFELAIELIETLIETMPKKGYPFEKCQRLALQNAINEFSYVVNGIESSDLED